MTDKGLRRAISGFRIPGSQSPPRRNPSSILYPLDFFAYSPYMTDKGLRRAISRFRTPGSQPPRRAGWMLNFPSTFKSFSDCDFRGFFRKTKVVKNTTTCWIIRRKCGATITGIQRALRTEVEIYKRKQESKNSTKKAIKKTR